VAVIKIEGKGLPVLPFGDSQRLRPGQIVLAFGSPLGLDSSVTLGVVSAVARQLTPEDPMIYIQTDAPINPGNSGGALVDTEGRLVGISTLIYRSGGSEGLASPRGNIVRNVFAQFARPGACDMAISVCARRSPSCRGLRVSVNAGVVLSDVTPGRLPRRLQR
jgi:serine protease Do